MSGIRTDRYGYGAAAISAFETFSAMMRGTGRTTRMISDAREGDTIVTVGVRQAEALLRLIKATGKTGISVVGIDDDFRDLENKLIRIRASRSVPGRLIFTEDLTEQYLRKHLVSMATDLAKMEKRFSDDGDTIVNWHHDQMLAAKYSHNITFSLKSMVRNEKR